ncbi:MAG: tripartite tricarboxylate transporter TctB family protein [Proteobacteria bacterium]|nr:tripartite tricarboxylate transporter TctB family protein [Pseudomonadota bacterium]
MSPVMRDRLGATVLFVAALVWVGLVLWTIPASTGAAAGSRAFPLWLGLALAAFSLLAFARTYLARECVVEEADGDVIGGQHEVFAVVSVVLAILVYGAMMEPLGFLPTTVLVVGGILIFVLGVRKPLVVLAVSIGLAVGCYIVFGKLLGTYLPPGTLIPIYL